MKRYARIFAQVVPIEPQGQRRPATQAKVMCRWGSEAVFLPGNPEITADDLTVGDILPGFERFPGDGVAVSRNSCRPLAVKISHG